MDSDTVKKLLDEFYPQLEALDTQCTAIRQYLKDERQITDAQFAPYLEQAEKASSVKWLASRLRIERLLSSATKESEKHIVEMAASGNATNVGEKPVQKTAEPASAEEKTADKNKGRKEMAASEPQKKETKEAA